MFTMEICYLGNSQSLRQGKKYIYICLYISHTQICSSAIVTLKRLIYLLSSPVTGKSVLFFHFKNANYPNNYLESLTTASAYSKTASFSTRNATFYVLKAVHLVLLDHYWV